MPKVFFAKLLITQPALRTFVVKDLDFIEYLDTVEHEMEALSDLNVRKPRTRKGIKKN
jgi:hypothetical protein